MTNTANTIKSPCVLICSIDWDTGLCFGCARSRDEIAGWMNYSNDERASIMASLDDRMKRIERKPRRITKRQRLAKEQEQKQK